MQDPIPDEIVPLRLQADFCLLAEWRFSPLSGLLEKSRAQALLGSPDEATETDLMRRQIQAKVD